MENYFGIPKSEMYYQQNNFDKELKKEIEKYIYYYNNQRIKSNIKKMSSIQYRTHFFKTIRLLGVVPKSHFLLFFIVIKQ